MAPNQALNALGHAVSGSCGTAISTATLYPLDLITTRLKAQRKLDDSSVRYDGVIAAFKGITSREGGIGALYNGLGVDVAKSVVDSFLFFGFYNYLRRRRQRRPKILEELAIGAVSGAFARLFTTPISNVVTRKQMSSGEQTLGEMMAAIRKQSGVLGLWSGYSATLVLTMNPSITFFVNRRLAERIIPALEDEDIPVAWIAFLIAAWSKATATAISYPFQTGKTRLQMASASTDEETPDEEKGREEWTGRLLLIRRIIEFLDQTIFGVVLRIIKKEGVGALYAGIQGELLKSFFSHGLTMLTKGVFHRLVIRLWFLLLPHLPRRRIQAK
ncbi:mitochondrial carrier domain-containing protein [Thelonectria olida]|uniref:Mitochondrial carrier domain-containing protein n=1 Tax=Thelonectria olida TaxID=1576542 RepID=A0A9P8W614_9HYPO|nr:mitochondrial carrier domain-containing protein [Thelonectria olida]